LRQILIRAAGRLVDTFKSESRSKLPSELFPMMYALLSLLIVRRRPPSTSGLAISGIPFEVFHCLFDESADKNFDGWARRMDSPIAAAGFPQYINIGIC